MTFVLTLPLAPSRKREKEFVAIATLLSTLLAGCSLILKVDYDAIPPDWDSAVADADAGDAGPDACVPDEMRETQCDNDTDDDCDGQVDCFDFDCRGEAVCCRGGAARNVCLTSTDLIREPSTGSFRFSGTCPDAHLDRFDSTPGLTRALITRDCQPINFGMRFEIDLQMIGDSPGCGAGCDYAGFALTPVQTIIDGQPLLSELRAIVAADGSARVERAGFVIGTSLPEGTFVIDATHDIELRVELEPGPDESGRDVLFATISFTQRTMPLRQGTILDRQAIMPLGDLRCLGTLDTGVGLFAAIEGAGSLVQVQGPLVVAENKCSNPSQFEPQPNDMSTPASCEAGGVGAPALVNYCHADCSASAQVQWDLWLDASAEQRADEIFRPIDFGVCGYVSELAAFPDGPAGDDWIERMADAPPFLWANTISSREPTLLPISDDRASQRVEQLRYAYAERMTGEIYRLRSGPVLRDPLQPPGLPDFTLAPMAPCRSLRDPLLVARQETVGTNQLAVMGGWLLFTCEKDAAVPRSIGIVELDASFDLVDGTFNPDFVTPEMLGAYAMRGVYAPEGFTEATDQTRTLRLWFSTRDGRGQVQLGYAQGRGPLSGGLPVPEPYPANPILDGASSFLGGDCSSGCTLTGASVTQSFNDLNDFQFVITRSRLTPVGAVHDLVPLLQPRPAD